MSNIQKSKNKSWLIGTVLGLLVVAIMGTFVVSGTLAKFVSKVGAETGEVPAAQFLFNSRLDNGSIVKNEWHIENLGALNDDNYSSKELFPGAYGQFSLDINFISDVPTQATVNVTEDVTGAFNAYELDGTGAPIRNLISDTLRFVVSTEPYAGATNADSIDFYDVNNSCSLNDFTAKLDAVMTGVIGVDGKYEGVALGTAIDETVYVYWKWPYEIEGTAEAIIAQNAKDTLFGNYVAVMLTREPAVVTNFGLGVEMQVEQINPNGYVME